MEEMIYEVVTIDGDYANLRNISNVDGDLKLEARALLPVEISEGCKLSYYAFEYTMLE
ncbi:MAG: chorismate--pyruvate lyase [Lachnospiraceae bacterium]|nr:chorismate--pyruvate lyase [Lachnospiraceae bacterium]